MWLSARTIAPAVLVATCACCPSPNSLTDYAALPEPWCPSPQCFRGEYSGFVEGIETREDGTVLSDRYRFTVRFDDEGRVIAVTDVCDNGTVYEFSAEGQQFRIDVAGNAGSAYQASTRILTIVGTEYADRTVTVALAFQRWERDVFFTAAVGTNTDYRVLSSRSDATIRLECQGQSLTCVVLRTSESAIPEYRSNSNLSGTLMPGAPPEPDFSGTLNGTLAGDRVFVDANGVAAITPFPRSFELSFNDEGRLVSCITPVEQIQLDRNYRCNAFWQKFIQPIQRIRTTYVIRDIEYRPNWLRFVIERASHIDDGFCYVSEGTSRTAVELTRNDNGPQCIATYALDSSWQEFCDTPRVQTHGEWIGAGGLVPID